MTAREMSRAKKKQLKALQLLVLLLPRENALLLECLLDLLHKVSVVEKNMMNPKSLGTVFAPHLICPRKVTCQLNVTRMPRLRTIDTFIMLSA